MAHLSEARGDEIAAIYRESHRLWGAGLSRRDYLGLWHEIRATEWATRHVHYLVWKDDRGTLLSSLKLYRPLLRYENSVAREAIIGAVFTPRSARGRGHARAMLEFLLRDLRGQGVRVVLLFSDIQTGYYESLGFEPLPCREQWGRLPHASLDDVDGWSLRPMEDGDARQILRAHEETSRRRSMAVVRDLPHWEFLRVRSAGFFRRLRDRTVKQNWRVAYRGDRFEGYLVTVDGRGEWSIREVGALAGNSRSMATILRMGAGVADREGFHVFHGWLPPEVLPLLGDWEIQDAARQRAIPMIRLLDERLERNPLRNDPRLFIPYQDQF